ncbi:MAG: hypothetical protein V7723_11275 [Sneathiella sp.]|uniref:DUF805 domain-containing protein n=1 Tax=Sneathiella sp. TaxID=1964365 RepID=UPI003002288A
MLDGSSDLTIILLSLGVIIVPFAIAILTIIFSNRDFTISRLMFFGAQIILTVLFIIYSSIVGFEMETLYPNMETMNLETISPYIALLITIGFIFFTYTGTASCVFRAQDMGFSKWLTLVLCIPIVGTLYFLLLLFYPSRSYS